MAMSETKNTRSNNAIFGLAEAISGDDAALTGTCLLTNRQVLRCMKYHIKVSDERKPANNSQRKTAKHVYNQLEIFYKKANIPIISEIKACQRIINLSNENAKLRRIPKERRSSQQMVNKIEVMEENAK